MMIPRLTRTCDRMQIVARRTVVSGGAPRAAHAQAQRGRPTAVQCALPPRRVVAVTAQPHDDMANRCEPASSRTPWAEPFTWGARASPTDGQQGALA
jgi:hypothetical protein